MTLLKQMACAEKIRREHIRLTVRAELWGALRKLLPGQKVFLFGSVVKPGRFTEGSDVDLAIESEPAGMTIYQLISLLGEHLGRRVDVVLLPECRFKDRILREAEVWIVPD